MFLIRRTLLLKQNSVLKLIQEQINSKNVDATSLSRGVQFCQQRFCSPGLEQQQPVRETENKESQKIAVGQIVTKLKLAFTCKKCSTRNNKFISKLGYEKGIVIVRCDGCKNNHLIADNLGWFSEVNSKTNIEYMLKKKGESVCRIPSGAEGYIELVAKEVFLEVERQKKLNESEKEKPEIEEGTKHQEAGKKEQVLDKSEEISNEKDKDFKSLS